MSKSKIELLKKIYRAGLKPLQKISVSEWADKYRVISEGNAEPGKWKTSRAEYQREIMNAFTQTGLHRVVVMTSSQIGKSDIMNNVIGRFAHIDPCLMMMVQPTVEMANDFSKSRISPMTRDTKVLKDIFFGGRDSAKTRNSEQTILSKFFPGGRLIMCGANSPAGLASRPVRILLCDEVDRFPESAGNEGDPVGLAEKRMTTFWNYILGLFSTPTTKDASRIEIEYKAGTQEEWQHKCPNCGEFHILDYRQMLTDYNEIKDESGNKTVIVKNVRWQCPDCGMDFDELQIKNSPAKYVAKNPEALQNGIRSFWLNAFSSPWLTWNDIMREWYEAKGNPSREKVVYNTRFGLSYELRGEYDDENEFLNRREDYPAELPNGVLVLTGAVDVQANRLEYEIVGWAMNEERFGILRGIIPIPPTNPESWAALDEVLDKEYHFANGNGLKVARTFVDSGFMTRRVYDYCSARMHRGRFPIKGLGGAGIPLLKGYGNPKNSAVVLTMLGVNDGKQEVFSRLGIKEVGEFYMHFPRDDKFLGTRGYDSVYFKQLISEKRVIKKSGGVPYVTWETIGNKVRNESLDLAVYNLACLKSLRINWEKQKALINGIAYKPTKKISPTQKSSVTASRNLNIW